VEASQRRELTQQMNRSTGSYELVVSPLILALIGNGLDRWWGTLPIFTILFAVVGLVGACIKIYYGYTSEMDQHDAEGPWAKRS
jgi:F0F1-type ATP synthase assembly protein I